MQLKPTALWSWLRGLSAENERFKLLRQHGAAMIAAKISKSGEGPTGTCTLAYTFRETRIEAFF